jgi:hypothetical protein
MTEETAGGAGGLMGQMLRSPQLALYVESIERVLEAERARRVRFHEAVREDEKAEFINGAVVVRSPVKLRHAQASDALFSLVRAYVTTHGLGIVGHEKLMISLSRNDYEPDVCFFTSSNRGGGLPAWGGHLRGIRPD